MDPITIAAVSCIIQAISADLNLDRHAIWAAKAAEAGADVVLFNELSAIGYKYDPVLRQYAEPLDGPVMQRLHQIAKANDIIVVAGLAEKDGENEFNTQVVVGPGGLIGKHRKSSLAGGPTDGEIRYFDKGDDYNVFDIKGWKVGISICFESVHPETCQKLADNGAEIILAPYMNGVTAQEIADGKRPYFNKRAEENAVWYVANDQCGLNHEDPAKDMRVGGVAFVNPFGEMVKVTPVTETDEHMLVMTLDRETLVKAREAKRMAGAEAAASRPAAE